jgi:hypothetical protein
MDNTENNSLPVAPKARPDWRRWAEKPVRFRRKRTTARSAVGVLDIKRKQKYFDWTPFRFDDKENVGGADIGTKAEPATSSKSVQKSEEQLIAEAEEYKPYTSAKEYVEEFAAQRETLKRWGPTQWPDYFTMEFESKFLIGVPKRRSIRSRAKHAWVKRYIVESKVHYNWDSDIITLEQGKRNCVTFSANDLRLILRDCDLLFESFNEKTEKIRAQWPPVIGRANRRARVSDEDAEEFRKELYDKLGRI